MRPSHLETFFNWFTDNKHLTIPYKEKIQMFKEYIARNFHKCYNIDERFEFVIYDKFLSNPNRIYKLCDGFSKDLYKVHLELPTNIIPNVNECVLIELPDWYKAVNSDGTYIQSCYVYQDMLYNIEFKKECRTLRLQFPDYREDGTITGSISFIWCNLETEKNISKLVDELHALQTIQINKDAILFVLKTYIYIHSGEPDLRFMKAVETPKTKKEKKLRHFIKDNTGLFFDFVYLGYFYKKQRFYNVDNIEVSGHMRWQRYGVGNLKVKLIWVDSYTKTNLKKNDFEKAAKNFVDF